MKTFYQKRIDAFSSQLKGESNDANRLSIIRGLSFILALVALIVFLSANGKSSPLWLLGAAMLGIVFYRVVLVHISKLKKVKELETFIEINEQEVQRISLELGSIENGQAFTDPEHPYHIDLDIFGKHSLFQVINRCQIPESRFLLAQWLSKKATIDEINERQEAVKELSKDQDWCQDFQVAANISINKRGKRAPEVAQSELVEWANGEFKLSFEKIWKPLTIVITVITLLMIAAVLFIPLPYQILYLLIFPNGLLLISAIIRLNRLSRGIDKANYLINTFLQVIPMIEDHSFESRMLLALKEKLIKNSKASKAIKKLNSITHRLAARSNLLYPLLDAVFLLDAYLLIDLYQWKKHHEEQIAEWLEVVNEIECLISLAGFAHAHPDYVWPDVNDRGFSFEAKALGHPLISPDEMVTNDYKIDGKGHIDILTGSNMSGKSTFERTVGVTMVLAQMGAPVYASSLAMGQTEIFTSMRTVDDISKHTSSFYAELKRINQLLEHAKSHPATFVLIDEVLKGTNSEDRHRGALALVNKLSVMNVFGMVSTHDLALGKETLDQKSIRNFSFNSEIIDDQIIFDYKLTKGLCKSFNASKLMEKMGITG